VLAYLVEDDPTSRDTLTRTLRIEDYEVIAFPNVIKAINYIDTHPAPDVALIDYKLPGGPNGTSLAAHVRQRFAHTAIVMISLYADKREIVNAFRVGIDDFIVRPAEPQDLLERISMAVVKRRPLYPALETFRTVGELHIDFSLRTATWYGVELVLTPTEFSILIQLTAKPDRIFNYAELYSTLRGEHVPPSDARSKLKSHVSNLKRKLHQVRAAPGSPLKPNHGFGLRWQPDGENTADNGTEGELV